MKFFKILSSSKGLTLIEVLVSLTILSIILLGIMNFFNQAYSYTNSNQKKTAAVNVARNALTFMEQSTGTNSFIAIRERLVKNEKSSGTLQICNSEYMLIWKGDATPTDCSPVTINNIPYHVSIVPTLDKKYTDYFIPLTVKVDWKVNKREYTTSVEGAIKSEDLR